MVWVAFASVPSAKLLVFSSPEPLAHGELLWSLDVRCASSVINNCFKGHLLLNYWLDFWPNLVRMVLIWPSLKFVQMVPIHCISRSHRLKIDFQDEKLKIFFSETTRPRTLVFGMMHHLVDLYQVYSNYPPGAKNGPAPGVTCFT